MSNQFKIFIMSVWATLGSAQVGLAITCKDRIVRGILFSLAAFYFSVVFIISQVKEDR